MARVSDGLHPDLTEAVFQTRVTDLCDWLRLRWHHETDSRKSPEGFPDLVIVGPGGLVFAELKNRTRKVTPKQQEWLDDLATAGVERYLWRPADWPEIRSVLDRLARPRPSPNSETRRT